MQEAVRGGWKNRRLGARGVPDREGRPRRFLVGEAEVLHGSVKEYERLRRRRRRVARAARQTPVTAVEVYGLGFIARFGRDRRFVRNRLVRRARLHGRKGLHERPGTGGRGDLDEPTRHRRAEDQHQGEQASEAGGALSVFLQGHRHACKATAREEEVEGRRYLLYTFQKEVGSTMER